MRPINPKKRLSSRIIWAIEFAALCTTLAILAAAMLFMANEVNAGRPERQIVVVPPQPKQVAIVSAPRQ